MLFICIIGLANFKVQMNSVMTGYVVALVMCGHTPPLFGNEQGQTLRRSATTQFCIIHEANWHNDVMHVSIWRGLLDPSQILNSATTGDLIERDREFNSYRSGR